MYRLSKARVVKNSKTAHYNAVSIVWVGLFLLAGMLFSGCVATKPASKPLQVVANEAATPQRAERLRAEAADWAGTPHEWGGTTRDGIDCSAFVQTVYKDLFTVNLPRTTLLQAKEGQPVLLNQLTVGDLLFYRIDSNTRHVGIYVGEDEFMHASKSEGVTITSIEDPYWENRFWTVRRILAPVADSSLVPAGEPGHDRARAGW